MTSDTSKEEGRRERWASVPGMALGWQKLAFLIVVIIPVALYACYLLFIATPRYEAEFRIQIKEPGKNAMSMGQLFGVAGLSSSATDNGYAVTQYLESANAISDLERSVNLRERYSRSSIDVFSRLSKGATIERFQRYWKNRLAAEYEQTSSTVRVRITAFSPDDAYRIANQSLQLSENLLNTMTTRSRRDSVRYAQDEVNDAENRLRGVEKKVFAVRSKEQVIDPNRQVTASMARIADLQKQVDLAAADVQVRQRYLSPSVPARSLAELRLGEAQARLKAARDEMANSRGAPDATLASTVSKFDEIDGERTFAEKRLENALLNLSSAESEAQRQQLYLDTVVRPIVPQEATFPDFFKNVGLALFFAVCGWAVLVILVSGVRDHVRV